MVEDPQLAVCSTEFMPFVPHKADWRVFVYELLRSAHVQNVIQSRATGTTSSRQRVRPSVVAEMNVLIPHQIALKRLQLLRVRGMKGAG